MTDTSQAVFFIVPSNSQPGKSRAFGLCWGGPQGWLAYKKALLLLKHGTN